MTHFAVIVEELVTNVIVANTLADAEIATNSVCVEITEDNSAGIGFTYDAKSGKFTRPAETTDPVK
jgi:hypothetical protein